MDTTQKPVEQLAMTLQEAVELKKSLTFAKGGIDRIRALIGTMDTDNFRLPTMVYAHAEGVDAEVSYTLERLQRAIDEVIWRA